jgi:putative membrane protein
LLTNKQNYIPMKKLTYMFMIAVSAYMLQGCNSSPKDAKQSADSLNKTKDTTASPAATGGIAVNADDAKFATAAANGGMAEVALGKLAQQMSTNDQIKSFGAMMVTDHGKANDELMGIAKTKNITLPATVDADHQKKMDDLSKLTGKDFNKAYVDAMIDGHKKTLDLMQNEAKNGTDADLKAFAAKTAPTVQMHLDAINKIHDSMK